jgi:hypothetical protein
MMLVRQRLLALSCIATITILSAQQVAADAYPSLLVRANNSDSDGYRKSTLGGMNRWTTTEKQVRRILGKPLKKTVRFECGNDEIAELVYKDIKVKLYRKGKNFVVSQVITTSPKYVTDKGIRVGDSIEQAKAAYPSLILNEFYNKDRPRWMSFKSQFEFDINNRGEITEIVLGLNTGC